MKTSSSIHIKSPEEIAIMRKGGKILADIISELESSLKNKAMLTTKAVDAIVEKLIKERNVIPAFKGYRGFPGCACVSVNEEIVHGIPSDRVINDGDIVSVDVGIIYKDFYADTAVTIAFGEISEELVRLMQVTQDALYTGIDKARSGNHLSDISFAIQQVIEDNELSIVREFVGHGIGKNLHEDPEIPNFGKPGKGPILEEGMVFAIEPMVNLGGWQARTLKDGWTVITQDRRPSAHFEHTVAIGKDGPEILTKLES